MPAWTTADGLALHQQHWPHPAPRDHVLVVHGLGEHLGRYERLAQDLVAAGYAVTAYDQRGHGRSPGGRGAIPTPEALLDDLSRAIDACRPGVLLGHSMGGLVAARFVAESLADRPAAWSRPVRRLVLSSPALDAGLGLPQRLLLGLMERVAPSVPLGNGLDPAWVCSDPAVVRAYIDDPLVHDRITARLVRFIVDGGERVRALAPRWATPTLLMWAGADRCVNPRGSQALADTAPAAVLSHRLWPTMAHEIFNEPERRQVVEHLVHHLQATDPGRSPP